MNASDSTISLGWIPGQQKHAMVLDGAAGDIILNNADCAEDFDIEGLTDTADPGTVMTIGDNGALRPCSMPYDRAVAGIVSGAVEI